MSLTIQKGFWQDTVIADTRRKLAELYYKNTAIAQSEKQCIWEFWVNYEGLTELLDGKLEALHNWFLKATSPETITRCLRSLKEDGTIELTPYKVRQREEREQRQV